MTLRGVSKNKFRFSNIAAATLRSLWCACVQSLLVLMKGTDLSIGFCSSPDLIPLLQQHEYVLITVKFGLNVTHQDCAAPRSGQMTRIHVTSVARNSY
jgi:hypothetical protein